MKVVGVVQKPSLKFVKVGDYEKPVIKVEMVIPYTEESWVFVGANAGHALNVALAPSQVEMFDPGTGEIMASVTDQINRGALDGPDGTTVRATLRKGAR